MAAGIGGDQKWLYPLTNRVSGYLGDISYSLYLWHFPAIILLGAVLAPDSWIYYTVVLVGTLALSVLSYHFIEDPVRRSTWLEPRRRRRNSPIDISPKLQIIGVTTLAVVLAGLIVYSDARERASIEENIARAAAADRSASPTVSPTGAALEESEAARIAAGITDALGASSFPEFAPPLDALGTQNWVTQVTESGCADISPTNYEQCASGEPTAPKVVAVFGDSYAIAWLPAVRAALEPEGYRIFAFTRGQCPSAAIEVTRDNGAPFPECAEHQQWATSALQDLKPDLVILANSTTTLSRLADGATGSAAVREYADGLAATVMALRSAAQRIVTLAAPPQGKALQECVTRVSTPSDCVTSITEDWRSVAAAEKSVAASSGTIFVESSPW